jgi:hypothetical protein
MVPLTGEFMGWVGMASGVFGAGVGAGMCLVRMRLAPSCARDVCVALERSCMSVGGLGVVGRRGRRGVVHVDVDVESSSESELASSRASTCAIEATKGQRPKCRVKLEHQNFGSHAEEVNGRRLFRHGVPWPAAAVYRRPRHLELAQLQRAQISIRIRIYVYTSRS